MNEAKLTDRLLTDKEALVALNQYPTHSGYVVRLPHDRPLQDFIRVMEAQDIKSYEQGRIDERQEIGEWLQGYCTDHYEAVDHVKRWRCSDCMHTLIEGY